MQALKNLNRGGVATTSAMTVAKGVSHDEIGAVIEKAAAQSCVRGVTLQPMQFAGRTHGVKPENERFTFTDVRQKILDQTLLFVSADIVPAPCNPDALSMAYALKSENDIAPLTHYMGAEALLAEPRNTIVFESDPVLKVEVFKLFATNLSPEDQANCLSSLMCCLPNIEAPANITYENLLRVLIMAFMDAVNFDVRAMKKSCVHIVQTNGRIIPFESFNLLYRDDKKAILAQRRADQDVLFGVRAPAKKVVPIKNWTI